VAVTVDSFLNGSSWLTQHADVPRGPDAFDVDAGFDCIDTTDDPWII